MGQIADDLLMRMRALDTTVVSDALDRLGLAGATVGVRPLAPLDATVVGRCKTVEVGPLVDDRPRPHLASSTIEASDSQTVIVVANSGRTDVSSWGGILSQAASRKGVRGVLVDGACRDIHESSALGFPVFGRAVVPVSARGRIGERTHNEPVHFAGVRVAPGDAVIADANGVVFVPQARDAEVVALAERIAEREARMTQAVQRGVSVVEVMHDTAFDSVAGGSDDSQQ